MNPFSRHLSRLLLATLLGAAAFTLPQCTSDAEVPAPPPPAPPVNPGERIYGVSTAGALVVFGSRTPETIISSRAITGLQMGETLRGIDFRSTDGVLFGVGSTNRVYTIDTTSGAATALPMSPFTPGFAGASFSFDFNPTANERARVHSNTGENRRLNTTDGSSASMDATLSFEAGDANTGTPALVAAAYTNNARNTTRPTTTTLWAIDATRDILVQVVPVPDLNAGVCATRGPLGFNASNDAAFDISARTGTPYATWTPDGQTSTRLYTITLATGTAARATLVGPVAVQLVAMAVPVF